MVDLASTQKTVFWQVHARVNKIRMHTSILEPVYIQLSAFCK